jgi:hypothetical protein
MGGWGGGDILAKKDGWHFHMDFSESGKANELLKNEQVVIQENQESLIDFKAGNRPVQSGVSLWFSSLPPAVRPMRIEAGPQ